MTPRLAVQDFRRHQNDQALAIGSVVEVDRQTKACERLLKHARGVPGLNKHPYTRDRGNEPLGREGPCRLHSNRGEPGSALGPWDGTCLNCRATVTNIIIAT
jgi:hypothetical protein